MQYRGFEIVTSKEISGKGNVSTTYEIYKGGEFDTVDEAKQLIDKHLDGLDEKVSMEEHNLTDKNYELLVNALDNLHILEDRLQYNSYHVSRAVNTLQELIRTNNEDETKVKSESEV